MPPDSPTDNHSEALKLFKDWNDKLLITAVAALGWVVGNSLPGIYSLKFASAACLALSIAFGILTLALIPLIREQWDEKHLDYQLKEEGRAKSIYNVRPFFWSAKYLGIKPRLTNVCMPSHALFYLGIVLYVASVASGEKATLDAAIGGKTAMFWTRPEIGVYPPLGN
ncbi:hypothetical protein SAMN04488498_11887 [Mesorhizobium albiziae]|uniref:Uncharacterized protein n=1 Tax=Neomesorhizobium albiziae TaxID=335020 RepID=A0A1I4DNK0_9HYPH|nr:hypothetical protein [Mesorhizobium albiziae]GLS31270.1 hypothetical protein GCM10007937_29800 [Mesorhizobium albiziae]SFK94539.1 hypothetical protein SAMN04488498_11887 [Mesorhizobium albiziae]